MARAFPINCWVYHTDLNIKNKIQKKQGKDVFPPTFPPCFWSWLCLLEVDEKARKPEGKKPGYFKHQNLRGCHVSLHGRCNVLATMKLHLHGNAWSNSSLSLPKVVIGRLENPSRMKHPSQSNQIGMEFPTLERRTSHFEGSKAPSWILRYSGIPSSTVPKHPRKKNIKIYIYI